MKVANGKTDADMDVSGSLVLASITQRVIRLRDLCSGFDENFFCHIRDAHAAIRDSSSRTALNESESAESALQHLKQALIKRYMVPEMQTHKTVVNDLLSDITPHRGSIRVLVFSLGFDSNLWNQANNDTNIWFVEDHSDYIKMNKDIDRSRIVYHVYKGINVTCSLHMPAEKLESYPMPAALTEHGPYDVIFIDGPMGYSNENPGRLLPVYWSINRLSRRGTAIYLDDVQRPLEAALVYRFLPRNVAHLTRYYSAREGSVRFLVRR